MDNAILMKERAGKLYGKNAVIVKNPEKLSAILNGLRWKILEILSMSPCYPALIAEKLGVHEQIVYYHIRQLLNAGIIEVKRTEEGKGYMAKYYQIKNKVFALELPNSEEFLLEKNFKNTSDNLRKFLRPFIINGNLNCFIVVGSPDPHGPFQVRGRDGHYAIELALFLGGLCSPNSDFSVKLDVDAIAENLEDNMIVIGGPLTNMLSYRINSKMIVKFETANFPFHKIISTKSSKIYMEDNVGFIAKMPNPQNPENFIMHIAGIRHSGTKSAIIALTKFHDKVLRDYENEDVWFRIVKGIDLDSDGKVDSIEILE